MNNYALVQNNIVINIVVWDGVDDIDFGDGVIAVEYENQSLVSIGYSYENGAFIPPPPTDDDASFIKEQVIKNNISIKNNLIATATSVITVWQTKLLVGRKIDASDSQLLNSWLDFIDTINKIDANTESVINWPVIPS